MLRNPTGKYRWDVCVPVKSDAHEKGVVAICDNIDKAFEEAVKYIQAVMKETKGSPVTIVYPSDSRGTSRIIVAEMTATHEPVVWFEKTFIVEDPLKQLGPA